MIQSEWHALAADTRDRMAKHVFPFTTPISHTTDGVTGTACGTGTYVEWNGDSFLLTNAHVADRGRNGQLAHLPGPTDDYVRCDNDFDAWGEPLDIALTLLGAPPSPERHAPISRARLDLRYDPAERELLFWLGYPASSARRTDLVMPESIRSTRFGTLGTPAVPVISQAFLNLPEGLPPNVLPDKHIVVHYPVETWSTVGGPITEVPHPGGMSGSLLWDTKRVACSLRGESWNPAMARVCGILWSEYRNPDIAVATRVEWLHEALREVALG